MFWEPSTFFQTRYPISSFFKIGQLSHFVMEQLSIIVLVCTLSISGLVPSYISMDVKRLRKCLQFLIVGCFAFYKRMQAKRMTCYRILNG